MTSAIGGQSGREYALLSTNVNHKTCNEHASLTGKDLKDYQKMCLG